jgi:branched-chain amino acid transport system substrate-binding protein
MRPSNRCCTSLIITAGLLSLTAACASQTSSGSASARGVTATTITVAGLSTTSGAVPWTGASIGAEARFARANREGGVDGRKIDYLGNWDDGSQPSQNLAEARQLVLEKNAFAIVPATSESMLPATTNFLNQQKAPFVGWGFMPGFCNTEYGYGFTGCLNGNRANMGLYGPVKTGLKLADGASVAVQSWDTTSGTSFSTQFTAAMKALDLHVVYDANTLPNGPVTDYSPYVEKLLGSNHGKAPDAIIVNTGDLDDNVGLTGALKSAGYKGPIVSFVTYLPTDLATDVNFRAAEDNEYVVLNWASAESNGPAIKQIQSDLAAIHQPTTVSQNVLIGYWSADVFLQMLQKVGRNLTPSTFGKVMSEGFTYKPVFTPYGLGPVQFPQNQAYPAQCGSMVQAEGTTYKQVLPVTCYSQVVPVPGS